MRLYISIQACSGNQHISDLVACGSDMPEFSSWRGASQTLLPAWLQPSAPHHLNLMLFMYAV
jgi:hypothetical protein